MKAPKDGDAFFDREDEMNRLLQMLEMRSRSIVLFLGPKDAGKSAILERLKELWAGDKHLAAVFPIFHLDLRSSSYDTPSAAAGAMMKELQNWHDWLHATFSSPIKISYQGVSLDFSALPLQSASPSLASVLERFEQLAYSDANVRPVFIIDEANRMKRWPEADQETFMACLVKMTKQDNRAQVIMSSSDEFFRSWVQVHVSPSAIEVIGVGYFKEESAKNFFSWLLSKRAPAAGSLQEADWKKIYEVCGGCPLLLVNCADSAYKAGRNLDAVLRAFVANNQQLVNMGRGETELWSGEKFEQVMKLIVADKQGAVPLSKIFRELFKPDRAAFQTQVNAMVAANLLHIRFAPAGADIVYDDLTNTSKCSELAMANNPAALRAMKDAVSGEDEDDDE